LFLRYFRTLSLTRFLVSITVSIPPGQDRQYFERLSLIGAVRHGKDMTDMYGGKLHDSP
jgi:hypothetical protein